MSQVIIVKDSYDAERAISRAQEHKISKEVEFEHWRLPDVTKPSVVAKLVGLALLPALAFWVLLMAALSLALTFAGYLFHGLANLVGKHKL